MQLSVKRHSSVLLLSAAVLLAGGLAGAWRYFQSRDALVSELTATANRSAVAFEADELRQLTGTPADASSPIYQRVKNRLARLRAAQPDIHFIFLLRHQPGAARVVRLADSEPSNDSTRPGTEYPDAAHLAGLQAALSTGRTTLERPQEDDTGTWIIAYAVIGNPPPGEPRDLIGCKLAAAHWHSLLWNDTLTTAAIVWLLLGLPVAAIQSIRRQQQQRDALRNLTEGMEQSHSAVLIFDLEGRIEYANGGCCRQTGYTRRELIGLTWRDFQGSEIPRESLDELLDTVRAGHAWAGEWLMQRKDESRFPVRGGVTPVKDRAGVMHSYVAVFEDMTEVRQTESALREAKDRAEAGDRAKSQFLATMSHEVRTPLNGIVGFSSLLLDTELSPEQQEYVETIRTSSETLIQLTGDILDYARIESGRLKLDPQPCDPRECIESALDLVAGPAIGKNIELLHWIDEAVPVTILVDVSRLRQVVVNLLNNAVKFTAEGEVAVTARALSVEPTGTAPAPMCVLEFTVRDTGIGIAPEHHGKIFRPFSQVDDSTTRRYGGTGLGLAICKNIVELMGGSIGFTSEAGQGSTFTFTIRVPVQTAAPTKPDRPLAGRRLAVVAPHGGMRAELSRLGQRLGATPMEVAADALASTSGWDLAILDVTGPAAMAIAGDHTPHPALPVEKMIALVPVVLPGELRTALRHHFRLVLNKPLHHDMLTSLLNAAPAPATAPVSTDTTPSSSQTRSSMTAETYQLRVLIAEDNAVNQRLIQKVVSNLGCEIRLAANGRLALTEIQRATPDIVLMDLHMPEMDGLTATIKIRAGEAGAAARDVWIIALTADAREEQRERTLAAGVNDYLTKPVRLPELTAAFRRYLATRPK